MKEIGKIYSIKSLFSEEDKAEHRRCKSGIESETKSDELIRAKTNKLIEDLTNTNIWEVKEINDYPFSHVIRVSSIVNTGNVRKGNNFICKPCFGYVLAFDTELQKFLDGYK